MNPGELELTLHRNAAFQVWPGPISRSLRLEPVEEGPAGDGVQEVEVPTLEADAHRLANADREGGIRHGHQGAAS